MSRNENANIWGLHAGKTGDADSLFWKKDCIAIGWPSSSDLSKLPANRNAFTASCASVYTHSKGGNGFALAEEGANHLEAQTFAENDKRK